MQDHHFVDHDGTRTPVAELPTNTILELLRDGVMTCGELTEESFLERLRIELVVRELGL